jgi:hypothetical protein
MKKESLDKLVNKYPIVFKHEKNIACGEGWVFLIDSLCSIIEHHLAHSPKKDQEKFHLLQAKSKFGSLRWYTSSSNAFIEGAIALAEWQSNFICEECGKPATANTINGWVSTLCEEHSKEEVKKY